MPRRKFSALPQCRKSKGKHASAKLDRPRNLRANRISASASADCTQTWKYIPERKSKHEARWTDKSPAIKAAVYNNRRRVRRAKGKAMQRRRSEVCERTFAHICDSGAATCEAWRT